MSFVKFETDSENKSDIISFLIGLVVSVILSFVLVIILAFALKWILIDEKYIVPLNLAIKVISVIVGASIAIRGSSKGLLKGVMFGFLYILLAFISFSILAHSFSIDFSLLLDVICTCITGGIIGIIKVNAR